MFSNRDFHHRDRVNNRDRVRYNDPQIKVFSTVNESDDTISFKVPVGLFDVVCRCDLPDDGDSTANLDPTEPRKVNVEVRFAPTDSPLEMVRAMAQHFIEDNQRAHHNFEPSDSNVLKLTATVKPCKNNQEGEILTFVVGLGLFNLVCIANVPSEEQDGAVVYAKFCPNPTLCANRFYEEEAPHLLRALVGALRDRQRNQAAREDYRKEEEPEEDMS